MHFFAAHSQVLKLERMERLTELLDVCCLVNFDSEFCSVYSRACTPFMNVLFLVVLLFNQSMCYRSMSYLWHSFSYLDFSSLTAYIFPEYGAKSHW